MIDGLILQFQRLDMPSFTKDNFPRVKTLLRTKSIDQFQQALDSRTDIIELEGWITAETVARIHDYGKKVLFDVANSPDDKCSVWRSLKDQNIDHILSDSAYQAKSHCS